MRITAAYMAQVRPIRVRLGDTMTTLTVDEARVLSEYLVNALDSLSVAAAR